jgi:uncharacterized protein (TIGR03118 family)
MKPKKYVFTVAAVLASAMTLATQPAAGQYLEKDLVSDKEGLARHTDPNLINGWGMEFYGDDGFIVADAGAGVATFYSRSGRTLRVPLAVPAAPSLPPGTPGSPAGLVANHSHQFMVSKNGKSQPALYIFATLDGTISAWNPGVDANPVVVVDNSTASPFPASYTDAAIGRNNQGRLVLYVTDSGAGIGQSNNDIEMYDDDFRLVGRFTDSHCPSNMTVYGAHIVDGKIYVASAGFGPDLGGVVDVFDMDGNFLRQLAANGPRGTLQAPWAVVRAPGGFGPFSNALLVGNVDSGQISAFDAHNGQLLGTLKGPHGNPVAVGGLWQLVFAKESRDGDENLFFSAGPTFPPNTAEYSDGLFGVITLANLDDEKEETSGLLLLQTRPKSRMSPRDH